MRYINPKQLKHWRTKRGLSMEDLASRATLDKSTINRIENSSKPKRPIRDSNLNLVAEALDVSAEQLADEADPIPDPPRREPQAKSQVTFRWENWTRNAMSFVSWRYRVKHSTIMELAPLLFMMVAEDSLRKRAEKLSALVAARGPLPKPYSDWAEEHERKESKSIQAKDIFGRLLNDWDWQPPQLPDDVEEVGQRNPLEAHIAEWFQQTGEAGSLSWPVYHLCREKALAAAGGDEELATALQEGWAGLHEMPHELWGDDMAEQRLQWLRAKVAAAKAEDEKERAAWSLGLFDATAKLFEDLAAKKSSPADDEEAK